MTVLPVGRSSRDPRRMQSVAISLLCFHLLLLHQFPAGVVDHGWIEVGGIAALSFLVATRVRPSRQADVREEDTSIVLLRVLDQADLPDAAEALRVRVENAAAQSHEVVIGRLLPGKTMQQALQWLNNGQKGPAPTPLGGASSSSDVM